MDYSIDSLCARVVALERELAKFKGEPTPRKQNRQNHNTVLAAAVSQAAAVKACDERRRERRQQLQDVPQQIFVNQTKTRRRAAITDQAAYLAEDVTSTTVASQVCKSCHNLGHSSSSCPYVKQAQSTALRRNRPSYGEFIDRQRQSHSQAYAPWTPDLDRSLMTHFNRGRSPEELAEMFGRSKRAILIRIGKLSGGAVAF